MLTEPKVVLDGFSSALGGIDSTRAPALLARNQLAFATNVSLRGGFPATRPRLDIKTMLFEDSETEAWFKTHRLQYADTFYLPTGALKIASIGGRIFSIDSNFHVLDITPRMDTQTDQQFTVPPVNGTVDIILDSPSGIFPGYPIHVGGKLYLTTVKTPLFDGFTTLSVLGLSTITASRNALATTTGATFDIGGTIKTGDTTVGSPVINNIDTIGIGLDQVIVGPDILTVLNRTDTPLAVIPQNTSVSYLDPNDPNQEHVWMRQDEDYWIIQDSLGSAIIFDGATARRAGDKEIPTGTAMVFNEEIGRFVVAVNGNEIAIGDIATSNSGPTGILKFTETGYFAEGGRFRIPRKFGKIIGIEMVSNLDRSNGQGPMIVFAQRGITTFNLPPNRESWKTLSYPAQINMPLKSATSQGSIVQVNGDLYYRAPDGLRSLVYAIREFTGPGNVPLSSELGRIFDHDDRKLLSYSSAVLFDNRIILTVSPLRSPNGIYHQGLAPLDLDLISRMGEKAPPIYEGIWTGLRPTRLLTDDDRCFLFALSANNSNELWELHKEAGFDNTTSRVVSSIETGAFNFQGGGQTPDAASKTAKKLLDFEIWVDSLVGRVDFLLQWRPDGYPCWFDWATAQVCIAYEDCPASADECKPLRTFNPGYATRIGFGQPPDSVESLDFKPARVFYHCQIRLVWTGQARIYPVFLVKAQQVVEPVFQVGGTISLATVQRLDQRAHGTRSRIGYILNETTGLWHLERARTNADGVLEFYLDEAGVTADQFSTVQSVTPDPATNGTLRTRTGYIQNETTRKWHLLRARTNADGVLEWYLDEHGIP